MPVKKDKYLEEVMSVMNEQLSFIEGSLIKKFKTPELPVLFVIGVQRSGTTILTQALANAYNISYPSNLIARFWKAPYIGALLSKSLKVNEEEIQFNSFYGATKGINGPHEFSYFWRDWFPGSAENAKPYYLSDEQKVLINRHFAAWQSVDHEPLLFKNLLEIIPNIINVNEIFQTAVFVNIIREDFFTIQSTYESRKKYGGSYDSWFGVKPSNYKDVIRISDPLLQTVEQVFYTKLDIASSLKKLPDEKYINVYYEDFISNPGDVLNKIESKFGLKKWRRRDAGYQNLNLSSGNKIRLKAEQVEIIKNRLNQLTKGI